MPPRADGPRPRQEGRRGVGGDEWTGYIRPERRERASACPFRFVIPFENQNKIIFNPNQVLKNSLNIFVNRRLTLNFGNKFELVFK